MQLTGQPEDKLNSRAVILVVGVGGVRTLPSMVNVLKNVTQHYAALVVHQMARQSMSDFTEGHELDSFKRKMDIRLLQPAELFNSSSSLRGGTLVSVEEGRVIVRVLV